MFTVLYAVPLCNIGYFGYSNVFLTTLGIHFIRGNFGIATPSVDRDEIQETTERKWCHDVVSFGSIVALLTPEILLIKLNRKWKHMQGKIMPF